MHDATLRPSAALIAYAEPYIAGRRVLVFGDATSALADQLLDRGARLVHMYDPDPARVAEAAIRNTESRVSLAPLSDGGLASREGAFDCALIEDLSSLPNRASALRALRRALSPRGVALIAAPNPDAERRLLGETPGTAELGTAELGTAELDYYGLYDAVSAELEHVRMLGQTPFVGYAVVDFALDKDPEPSFDSSFVPGGAEEPEQYFALASMQEIRFDEMMIVQLPLAGVHLAGSNESALMAARAAERKALKRISAVEAELRRARQSGEDLSRLQGELDQRDGWIVELESRAEAADARADDAESELEVARQSIQELTARLAELDRRAASPPASVVPVSEPPVRQGAQELALTWREELEEARHAAERAERERAWAEQRARKLQDELDVVLREVEESAAEEGGNGLQAEVTRLEGSLAEQRVAFERVAAQLKEVEGELSGRDAELAQVRKALAQQERLLEEERQRAQKELSVDSERDFSKLEEQLAARGRYAAELEVQLRKLERYGRVLVAELTALKASEESDSSPEPQIGELRTQLDRLAELNAVREADLVAAEWVIAELRDKLSGGAPPQVTLLRV